MIKTMPDFIIGGAPRSGTTYLCHLLAKHPSVFVAKPYIPEPKVLVAPFSGEDIRTQIEGRYRQLFQEAPTGTKLVEKTSYYLESREAASLIREHMPNVKMIFILREPVARAYSNYQRTVRNGLEKMDFLAACRQEKDRTDPFAADKPYVKPFNYLERGKYDEFFAHYLSFMKKENIAVFLQDQIQGDLERMVHRLFAFMNIEQLNAREIDPGMVNDENEIELTDQATIYELKEFFTPNMRRLQEMVDVDLSCWGYKL